MERTSTTRCTSAAVADEPSPEGAKRVRVGGDGGRVAWGLVLAIVAPGSGLVVLRRDWLGLGLAAVWSGLAAALAWLLLLGRAEIGAAGYALVVAAGCVWMGQLVMTAAVARRRFGARGVELSGMLLAKADACILDDRLAEAERHLRGALAVDDESPLHWRRLAELMTLLGKFDAAIASHERVIDLDVLGEHRRESILAIEKLRAVGSGRGETR